MTTKRDQIAEQIREMIIKGEIARGDRVMQDKLADLFGTSITPVREALLLLEAQGVLVGEPHRGLRIAEADPEQLKVVYILRQLAEPFAMSRAMLRVTKLDLVAAHRLVDAMEAATSREDLAEVSQLNRQFHFLFFERTGIPALEREISALWTAFPWDVLQVLSDRPAHSVKEHREILNAVEAEDAAAVEEQTRRHLWESYLALVTHLTGEAPSDPMDISVD